MPVVRRVFGRTKESELVTQFSSWLVENLDVMDAEDDDEDKVQGTMTIDFQHPTSSFVVEVQTYSEEFALIIVAKMQTMGFDNASTLGIEKEGGIK
jgi:hypothetical protein